MELLKITDIMERCGVGRATATRMANESGAIIQGRLKGRRILVNAAKFQKYLERGGAK